jgi:hypothetical protein
VLASAARRVTPLSGAKRRLFCEVVLRPDFPERSLTMGMQSDKAKNKKDLIVQLGIILVGVLTIFTSIRMYIVYRILLFLLWVIIAAIIRTKKAFIIHSCIILAGILTIFTSIRVHIVYRIFLFLLWVIIAAIIMEYRKQTLKFVHYFMFGIPSAIIGITLRVAIQNQHIFPALGTILFVFIPVIILIAATISAVISLWLTKSNARFVNSFLTFVLANLISFSLCFFGFTYHFSIT